VQDTARDLWRIAKELPRSDAAGLLTTIASAWIVLLAACSILRRVGRGLRGAWGRLRGGRAVDEDQFPEGA
jgi:hypothetical protein